MISLVVLAFGFWVGELALTRPFLTQILLRFASSVVMKKKQDDMRKHYNHPKIKFYIGDVRDHQSVSAAMRGVDYVFHAAALKGAIVRVLSHAGGAHQCAGHRKRS